MVISAALILSVILLVASLYLAALRGIGRQLGRLYQWLPRLYLASAIVPSACMQQSPLLVLSCSALGALALNISRLRWRAKRATGAAK